MGYKLCMRFSVVVGGALLLVCAPHSAWSQGEATLEAMVTGGRWLDFNAGLRQLDVRVITVDPTRPERLYVASDSAVYRSVNRGESWESTLVLRTTTASEAEDVTLERPDLDAAQLDALDNDQLAAIDERLAELQAELFEDVEAESDEVTAALAVEEAQDDLLLQATEEVLEQSGSAERFDLSEEEEEAAATVGDRFTQITVDPQVPARVYAASGQGLYASTDHGRSWTASYRGVGETRRTVFAVVVTGEAVVIATGGGVMRSLDSGETWSNVSGPPGNSAVPWLVASPSLSSRLYLIAEGRIHRSDDSGESWVPRGAPPGLAPLETRMIAVHPEDPDRLYLATTEGVMVSSDAGLSFDRLARVGLRSRNVLWVEADATALLAGTADGFFASLDDGGSWREVSEGLSASTIRQMSRDANAHVWAATERGVFQLLPAEELVAAGGAARRATEFWGREPNLGQTVRAALSHYGLRDIPTASWGRRIWWSNWVPDVRVQYRLLQQRNENRDFIPGTAEAPQLTGFDVTRQDDGEFRVLVLWDLSDLISGGQLSPSRVSSERLPGGFEVEVYSLDPTNSAAGVAETLARSRNSLIRRVIRTFDARRELILAVAERGATTLQRQINDELALQELTARLDLFTGGFFSAYSEVGGR